MENTATETWRPRINGAILRPSVFAAKSDARYSVSASSIFLVSFSASVGMEGSIVRDAIHESNRFGYNSGMRCIAIAAVTIVGKIALDAGHFSDWTSPEDKDFLHEMLDKSDVIVVGNNTYKTAVEPLSKRNCIVFTASVATTERKSDKLLLWNPATVGHSNVLQNVRTIAVLGGTQTYTYFLENDLLDELYITIE